MRPRIIVLTLGLIVLTYGLTRFFTIRGTLEKCENHVSEFRAYYAKETVAWGSSDGNIQDELSRLQQKIYFCQGIYQWRLGLELSMIVALLLIVWGVFGFRKTKQTFLNSR